MEEQAKYLDQVFFESDSVFRNAIKDGFFSELSKDKNFVGDFMYMHSKMNPGQTGHFFKNINTRKYIEYAE